MTPGYILADKYRLVSVLGRGGMGAVWFAERLEWGSPVAVKLLERASEVRPDVLARFLQEARLAANLRSSHVVQVLDDGRDAATGTPFIVMELLVGETLAQRLARVQQLTPAETSRVVMHVARALALAHGRGMVHRDLKPDNIFLVRNDDEDTAKVLDFGIAKWHVQSLLAEAPTTTGTAIGTPAYMSPEQIRDSKRVDFRADLWSLALIACECLTGRRPFEADNLLGLALQICNQAPPVPSRLGVVPPGFDSWFARATERQPERRFGSARELSDELRRVCEAGLPSPARRAAEPPCGQGEPLGRDPTERLARPQAGSTEGLSRTRGAVAGFRPGRGRRRALGVAAAALVLTAIAAGVRSELSRPSAAGRVLAATAAERGSDAASAPPPTPSGSFGVPEARAAGAEPDVAGGGRGLMRGASAALDASGSSRSVAAAASASTSNDAALEGMTGARAAALGAPEPSGSGALPPVVAQPIVERSGPAAELVPGSEQAPEPHPDRRVAPESTGGSSVDRALVPSASRESSQSQALPDPVEPQEPGPLVTPLAEPAPALTGPSPPFDRAAATAALLQAATQARSCRPAGGPRGTGDVQVRFEPSGKVGAAWLMTPRFDNTVAGACVLMLFRRAHVPEFSGSPELATQSFVVP